MIMYVHVMICMYVFMYVCIYVCIYVCMYVCMYVCRALDALEAIEDVVCAIKGGGAAEGDCGVLEDSPSIDR